MKIAVIAGFHDQHFSLQFASRRLRFSQFGFDFDIVWVQERSDGSGLWNTFMK